MCQVHAQTLGLTVQARGRLSAMLPNGMRLGCQLLCWMRIEQLG